MELGERFARALAIATLVVGVAACGDESTEEAATTAAIDTAVTDTAVTEGPNQAPVISGTPGSTAIEGQLYEFTPRASDPDGDALTFSVEGKPDWLAFDTRNGRLSGVPSGADIGLHEAIVVSVSDGALTAELAPAMIEVIPASASDNAAPEISGTPPESVLVGDFYDFIPFASDPDGDSLSFEIQNLPAWADFYPPTGRLSGTPAEADVGTYGNIIISVDDGIATRSLDPFIIVVNPRPDANRAPTISGQPASSVIVGAAYAFIPTATDADGDVLSFRAVNLPDWAAFNPTTGAMGGVPGTVDVGLYEGISIVVSDGQASAALASFSIEVVRPNAPPTIGGTPAGSVTVGDVYSFVPVVSDSDGDVLSFSAVGLPAWASLNNASGALTGVPGDGDVGVYSDISIIVTDGEAEAVLGPFAIEVVTRNTVPVISGTPPGSILAGQLYDFVPVASDADGDALSFSIQNAPGWTSFDPLTGRLTGTPTDAAVGTYGNIVISVSDGTVTSSLDPFVIVVNPQPVTNSAPIISGLPPASVLAGATYSFTPTASDPDGDTLSFSIVNQPSWAQFDATTGTLSGVPAQEDDGVYTGISIVVSDGEASTALPSFQIEVIGTNSPPTIGGTPPATIVAGDVYSFLPTAIDADGDRLTFTINGGPTWARFKKPTGALNGVPDGGDVGVYSNISITVSDGEDSATLGPFSIEVLELNVAPEISGAPAGSVTVGETYSFAPVASDANGDALSFSIQNQPGWASFSTATGQLSGAPVEGDVGTYGGIVISVNDGAVTTSLDPFAIVVNPEPVTNTAPTISGAPATSVLAGAAYSFTPTAADADGDALTFSIFNQPGWASFDTGSGALSGTPDVADDGVYAGISIVVSDGEASTGLPSFSIAVVAPNTAPTISGTPASAVSVDDVYSFVPAATDADGDVLLFSIVGLPAWASFNTATGALNGVPAEGDVGVYAGIAITVSDGEDSATLGPFAIEVLELNLAPEISGVPAGSVTVGESYSFTPVASDPNGDTLSFSIINQPAWSSFNALTGQLSGAPADEDAGTYGNIVINVSDGAETSSLAPFVIVVNPAPVPNTAPTISGTPATSVLAEASYSFTPTASDVDDDPLSFSVVSQPAWAAFDPATGTLSGTPGVADAGVYSGISIVVSDGEASTALPSFRIEVIGPNNPPTIGGSPAASVLVGELYSFVPAASDADGDALSFSIAGLPAWAGFNSATGALTGVPAPVHGGVSYNNISITVSDGEDTATLGPFSIEVLAPNQAPTIGGTPASSVVVGQAYSFTPVTIDVDGDPLTFSIVGKPSWASFDSGTGALTGTPSAGDVGIYNNISITVSDGEDQATLGPFSIEVEAIGTGSATLTWTPPTENSDGTALTDLSGYTIYWGTVSGEYSSSVTLENAGLTSYVVENLTSGTTYYFATTAYNAEGIESDFSNEASKTIP